MVIILRSLKGTGGKIADGEVTKRARDRERFEGHARSSSILLAVFFTRITIDREAKGIAGMGRVDADEPESLLAA